MLRAREAAKLEPGRAPRLLAALARPVARRHRARASKVRAAAAAGGAAGAAGAPPDGGGAGDGGAAAPAAPAAARGPLARVRALVSRHGPGAALAYLSLSNALSVGCLSLAWLAFTRASGASPLAPGAWPKFALAYAPFYCALQAARPARLAAGLLLAPLADRALGALSARLRVGRGAALAAALVVEAALLLAVLGLVVAATARVGA
jgi:hypothetical protein